ncbi:mucin-associated surface protein (MASP), putative, partial [Trypanosoma cruzi]
ALMIVEERRHEIVALCVLCGRGMPAIVRNGARRGALLFCFVLLLLSGVHLIVVVRDSHCWMGRCVAVCCVAAVSFLLLPLCVDGELACAEGYTQVTGVMAMMMTGRVLLVCALCVLWCVVGGIHARDIEKNAGGGCVASGVLGGKTSYLSSGCHKTTPTLPLRSMLPIAALQADDREEEVSSTKGTHLSLNGKLGAGGGSPSDSSP